MKKQDSKTQDSREEERIAGLYDWLTREPDLAVAVRGLTTRSLRELGGYLMLLGADENGEPGEVLGVLLVESWLRFLKMKDKDKGKEIL